MQSRASIGQSVRSVSEAAVDNSVYTSVKMAASSANVAHDIVVEDDEEQKSSPVPAHTRRRLDFNVGIGSANGARLLPEQANLSQRDDGIYDYYDEGQPGRGLSEPQESEERSAALTVRTLPADVDDAVLPTSSVVVALTASKAKKTGSHMKLRPRGDRLSSVLGKRANNDEDDRSLPHLGFGHDASAGPQQLSAIREELDGRSQHLRP